MSIIRKHKRGRRSSVTRNKKQGGNKKTRRGGGRDENVQQAMSGWRPGFDHPDQRVPDHVLRNITGHLQAQEEGNPRYGFIRFPSPVLKQTMDKVEEPPPLSYPPPPKLSEEQKNNMIIQQYTSIPDSGKILPMKFIVSENDPRTGSPFKVTYGDAGRIQFLHLKAVGDVPYWDESWLEPKRFHQSFKFPRPAPVLDDGWKRQYGSDVPALFAPDRRGDILVAIDPFSKRDNKVIAEIGEVIRFPMSCSQFKYTTHCFKIFFKTPKELDFTSGQSDSERRQPYELTLPPQTVIRVIRGRKTDYPPMTPRDSFIEPPKGGRRKTKKNRRKKGGDDDNLKTTEHNKELKRRVHANLRNTFQDTPEFEEKLVQAFKAEGLTESQAQREKQLYMIQHSTPATTAQRMRAAMNRRS